MTLLRSHHDCVPFSEIATLCVTFSLLVACWLVTIVTVAAVTSVILNRCLGVTSPSTTARDLLVEKSKNSTCKSKEKRKNQKKNEYEKTIKTTTTEEPSSANPTLEVIREKMLRSPLLFVSAKQAALTASRRQFSDHPPVDRFVISQKAASHGLLRQMRKRYVPAFAALLAAVRKNKKMRAKATAQLGSGIFQVDRLIHRIKSEGWSTEFQVKAIETFCSGQDLLETQYDELVRGEKLVNEQLDQRKQIMDTFRKLLPTGDLDFFQRMQQDDQSKLNESPYDVGLLDLLKNRDELQQQLSDLVRLNVVFYAVATRR